jgi:C1A family cysteine protease
MKKTFSIFLTLSIILCGAITISADEGKKDEYTPLNPEYVEYYEKAKLENGTNIINYGSMPPPYQLPYIENSAKQLPKRASNNLPSSYNNNSSKQFVSPVEDQGNRPLCWIFSTTATLESAILKQNNITNASYNDFSENHPSYALSYVNSNPYGYIKAVDSDGYNAMMTNYYTRNNMNGPVKQSEDPYDWVANPNRTYEQTKSKNLDNYYVRETIELPNLSETNCTTEQENTRITELKDMIYNYGGVCMAFNMNYSIVSENNAYHYVSNNPYTTNHLVELVGWDDNYLKSNFLTGYIPSKNGAFVAKNSWGTNWGENGYFYISYDDVKYFRTPLSFSDVSDRIFFDNIYEYDDFCITGARNTGNTGFAVNRFSKNDTDVVESLNSLMTFIYAPGTYVKVYVSPTGNASDLQEYNISNKGTKYSNGYLIDNAGYVTLDLSSAVEITGNEFLVGIQYYNSQCNYNISIESKTQDNNATSAANQSYCASTASAFVNGNYTDIGAGNNGYNACIKAFTTNDEIFINFTDEKFDNLGTITNNYYYNYVTFEGTADMPLYLERSDRHVNGLFYHRALIMPGRTIFDDVDPGTIYLNVNGPTEIYITAKSYSDNNSDNDLLHVLKHYGNSIPEVHGSNIYNNGVEVKKFVYSDPYKATIQISAGTTDMKIYSIGIRRIKGKDVNTVNKFWDLDRINNFTDLTLLPGITTEDFHVTNDYGITYSGYVNLQGEGNNERKSIIFYSPANTDIYVSARSSGTVSNYDERVLCLVNKFGYLIGQTEQIIVPDTNDKAIGTNVRTYRFTYLENHYNGEKLYLRSLDSGIDIYDIRLKTRVQNNTVLNNTLNFGLLQWNTNTLYDDRIVDSTFTIKATDEKPVSVESKNESYNGINYTKRFSFQGGGSTEYRSIAINVPGNAEINAVSSYISTPSAVRELVLFDENLYIVGKYTITSALNDYTFNYEGGENTLYLRTKEYNAYLFSVNANSTEPETNSNSVNIVDSVSIAEDTVSGSAIAVDIDFADKNEEQEDAENNKNDSDYAYVIIDSDDKIDDITAIDSLDSGCILNPDEDTNISEEFHDKCKVQTEYPDKCI